MKEQNDEWVYKPLVFPVDEVMKQLSDEQRKTINEWHNNCLKYEKEERKEEVKIARAGAYCTVIPLSVWNAVRGVYRNGIGVFGFLAEIACGALVFAIVIMIGQRLAEEACKEGFSKGRLVGYGLVYAAIVLFLAASFFS